jgi:RimJ/RimL family protein N-acetyltransferase
MQRKATEADFDIIYDIYMDPVNNPFLLFEPMPRLEFAPIYQTILAAGDCFVYEAEGRIISTYRIQRKSHRLSHIAYLGGFAMHPEFRGRGLGKKIMLEIISWLKNDGVKRFELLVVCDNERAINFYKKLGFEEEGRLRCFLKRANSPEYLDEISMAKLL